MPSSMSPPLKAAAHHTSAIRPAPQSWIGMLGPAFVAGSAYVDPGNFATNMAAGSAFGYQLLWVIVLSSVCAMLVQATAAKLGLATGRDLARLCRDHLPRRLRLALWVQAEAVMIATDLAEVVGGALALQLLFGVPLPIGGAITGVTAFAVLSLETRGQRRFEAVVATMFLVIVAGFCYDLTVAGVSTDGLASGISPGFAGPDSLLLATGIVGATVMPHAIYLHPALMAGRRSSGALPARRTWLRGMRTDVAVALGIAATVNVSMLVIAAQLFAGKSLDDLTAIHGLLDERTGSATACAFALALLASGFAASSVGTYAGQAVMAGFLRRSVPLLLRRAVTLVPALTLLAVGVRPTTALVWSQVVLSFGVPFALVPLVWFTSRRDLMGGFVNRRTTTLALSVITALIVALNVLLLWGALTS
ncbi:Nramp family divalent metal transporter [Streptomyces sp. NPDC006739]|uniref:Nramp family divalent metal transporter n=1 Tax=Streptomyces sp. NPDC006739 TaxID=3364763 RepID=UPI0036A11165